MTLTLDLGLRLDQGALCENLARLLDTPRFGAGMRALAGDRFFVAHFLASVSQGEGLGEAAVGMVGQEELAHRIRDLKKQELEERGHKEQTLAIAERLFPEYFAGGRYRFEGALSGRPYYVAVLEANRARLKRAGRYSRLSLYLTTTFAYEVMVLLLYRAVADAVAASDLDADLRERVGAVLESILAEEETHLGVLGQHEALLATDRSDLGHEAREMLDTLELLDASDYEIPARHAVEQVVVMMERYAEPERYRVEIEAGAVPASAPGP